MTQLSRTKILSPLQRKWSMLRTIYESQRLFLRNELSQVRGLIPILMKRRNGGRWSTEERTILQRDLRALSNLGPYLIPLILPGGILMLPFLAWWLDCRRKGRVSNAGSVGSS